MTVLLGMTLIPTVLVLLIGSEPIRNNVDRWFNADLSEVLSSANRIAGATTPSSNDFVAAWRSDSRVPRAGRSRLCQRLRFTRFSWLPMCCRSASTWSRSIAFAPRPAGFRSRPSLTSRRRRFLRQYARLADRLAERVATGGTEARVVEQLSSGGDLIRTAVPVRAGAGARVSAVVVASRYLTDQFAARARDDLAAHESYQLRVLKQPILAVYQGFF